MLIVQVHVHVKPEHLEEFKQATIVNATASLKEAGIAQFDVLQQEDDPTRFVLYEVYRDVADTQKHRESAHYQEWVSKAPAWMVEERTRVRYNSVFPPDQDW